MCGGGGGWGGGGGGSSSVVGEASSTQAASDYKVEVNERLSELLRDANYRDTDKINQHLMTIHQSLQNMVEEDIDLRFGGSVAKHTYVDGLSDVDILVVIGRETAETSSPKALIDDFARALRDRLPYTDVTTGALSVKVKFADGVELQLLPAFKVKEGYRIPRAQGESWSGVIRPREFAQRLTQVNQTNGGNVVSTIKLFKVAQDHFPDDAKLSGYQIEAMAVEAFEEYRGQINHKDMFLHLLEYSADRVRRPMEETTGQSTYTDSDLGPAESEARLKISSYQSRLHKRLQAASDQNARQPWIEAF